MLLITCEYIPVVGSSRMDDSSGETRQHGTSLAQKEPIIATKKQKEPVINEVRCEIS